MKEILILKGELGNDFFISVIPVLSIRKTAGALIARAENFQTIALLGRFQGAR